MNKGKIQEKLRNYAIDNNEDAIRIDDIQQCKYFLYYDEDSEKIMIDNVWNSHTPGTVYFTSPEICIRAIEEIGEDNLKYLLGDIKPDELSKTDYVQTAKQMVINMLRAGDTPYAVNDLLEIRYGNTKVLKEHIKAIYNIFAKALYDLDITPDEMQLSTKPTNNIKCDDADNSNKIIKTEISLSKDTKDFLLACISDIFDEIN